MSEATFPHIKSIGKPSAEEDAVLDYFLTTDSVRQIDDNEVFLILGRKGAGKTALVRHFTKDPKNSYYRALNLRGYPWELHGDLARCLIPRFDGAILSLEWKEAVWDRYVTGAPRPRTLSEQQYSDRKLRSRR